MVAGVLKVSEAGGFAASTDFGLFASGSSFTLVDSVTDFVSVIKLVSTSLTVPALSVCKGLSPLVSFCDNSPTSEDCFCLLRLSLSSEGFCDGLVSFGSILSAFGTLRFESLTESLGALCKVTPLELLLESRVSELLVGGALVGINVVETAAADLFVTSAACITDWAA